MGKIMKLLLFIVTAGVLSCDPCADAVCENGYCDNGDCQCLEGYTGERCEERIPARYFSISRVQVLNFPAANRNGRAWDGGGIYPGSGPADLFAAFFSGGDLIGETNVVTDGPLGTSLYAKNRFWAPVEPRAQVSLIDWDGPNAFELMGSYTFEPLDYARTQPPVIELYNSAGWHQIRMLIHMEWKW